jgi:Domain of unknown function (DUF4259)
MIGSKDVMGAWGVGSFDNDAACDWAGNLAESDDLSPVHDALAEVLDTGDEFLDSDLACEALAACEVLARLKGKWGVRNSYTELMDSWVESHTGLSEEIEPEVAIATIDRILSPPSELLELWEEGDPTEWRESVLELRTRILS